MCTGFDDNGQQYDYIEIADKVELIEAPPKPQPESEPEAEQEPSYLEPVYDLFKFC